MSCNPFSKEMDIINPYGNNDFQELTNRFKYLTEIKGRNTNKPRFLDKEKRVFF